MAEPDLPLSVTLPGTWQLVSRRALTTSGRDVTSPGQVIGLLIYDRHGNFAAQFMRRDRDLAGGDSPATSGAPNNSRTVNGYDAYFGRYTVSDESSTVTQTLVGSLAPENVGQVLERRVAVSGDELIVTVDTAAGGEPAVLTLRWRRSRSDH